MSKIIWDQIGEKLYEIGADHGVLYPQKNGAYPKGVAWSGLTNVTENASGAEENKYYADNIAYLSVRSAEEYGLTIESYFYPDEFEECNGDAELASGVVIGQQRRNTFGFSYRTNIGNDTDGTEHGYRIHLVYGCSASPSEKTHESVNDSPDPGTLSFEVSTIPVPVPGKDEQGREYKPTSHLYIDSTRVDKDKLEALEAILYGTNGTDGGEGTVARLPLPAEVKELFAAG